MIEQGWQARVPEHSLPLMQAMSGGQFQVIDHYLFFSGHDLAGKPWLTAIGYPLQGRYSQEAFARAIDQAICQQPDPEATACFAIAPAMPAGLANQVVDQDRYYLLAAGSPTPARLRGPLKRLCQSLQVVESTSFSPGHRRLWAEFLARADREKKRDLAPHVRELYSATPAALSKAGGSLRLLSALDAQGNVVACLLLDYAPQRFVAYVLGAHSRQHYVAHAADLLFAEMLERAKKAGKRYVHLGLGVDPGILRFKLKWGAKPWLPYQMAAWQGPLAGAGKIAGRSDPKLAGDLNEFGRSLSRALLRAPVSRQRPVEQRTQRPFAMLWQLEKNGRRSWIGGTAHFFCHSFEDSFRSLFELVDNVIFEGPLDDDFMARVAEAGASLAPDARPLASQLEECEIRRLERTVRGPEGPVWRLLGAESKKKADVRAILAGSRPWHVFFSLWTGFLERQGWHDSVDMEAWRLANELGKNVIGMENLEEQLASLDSVPEARVLHYLRACKTWPGLARRNMRMYLAGDLDGMMGTSAEFPTRTGQVINLRDQRFLERMLPWIGQGRTAVFVGAAHMVNLRSMLAEQGFSVRRVLPTLGHRLRAWLRRDKATCPWPRA